MKEWINEVILIHQSQGTSYKFACFYGAILTSLKTGPYYLPWDLLLCKHINADTDSQINEGKQFIELIFGVDVIKPLLWSNCIRVNKVTPQEHEENHLTAFSYSCLQEANPLRIVELALRHLSASYDCSPLMLFLCLLRNPSYNKSCCCGFGFVVVIPSPPPIKYTGKVPIIRQGQ